VKRVCERAPLVPLQLVIALCGGCRAPDALAPAPGPRTTTLDAESDAGPAPSRERLRERPPGVARAAPREEKLPEALRSAAQVRSTLELEQDRIDPQDRLPAQVIDAWIRDPLRSLASLAEGGGGPELALSTRILARPDAALMSVFGQGKQHWVSNAGLTLDVSVELRRGDDVVLSWSGTGTNQTPTVVYLRGSSEVVSALSRQQWEEALAGSGVFSELAGIWLLAFGPDRLVPLLADGGALGDGLGRELKGREDEVDPQALLALLDEDGLPLSARQRVVDLIGARPLPPGLSETQRSVLFLLSRRELPMPADPSERSLALALEVLGSSQRAAELLTSAGPTVVDPVIALVRWQFQVAQDRRTARGVSVSSGDPSSSLSSAEKQVLAAAAGVLVRVGDPAVPALESVARRGTLNPAGEWGLDTLRSIDTTASWDAIRRLADGSLGIDSDAAGAAKALVADLQERHAWLRSIARIQADRQGVLSSDLRVARGNQSDPVVPILGVRFATGADASMAWIGPTGELEYAPPSAKRPPPEVASAVLAWLEEHRVEGTEPLLRGAIIFLPPSTLEHDDGDVGRVLRDVYADAAHAIGRSGFDVGFLMTPEVPVEAWAALHPEDGGSWRATLRAMELGAARRWLDRATSLPSRNEWDEDAAALRLSGHSLRPAVSPFDGEVTAARSDPGGWLVEIQGDLKGRPATVRFTGLGGCTVSAGDGVRAGFVLGAGRLEEGRTCTFSVALELDGRPVLDRGSARAGPDLPHGVMCWGARSVAEAGRAGK